MQRWQKKAGRETYEPMELNGAWVDGWDFPRKVQASGSGGIASIRQVLKVPAEPVHSLSAPVHNLLKPLKAPTHPPQISATGSIGTASEDRSVC